MRFPRRLLLIAAVLMLMCGAAAEGLLCVATDTCAALLHPDGTEIVAPGLCADIYPVCENERYALGIQTDSGMRYALADARGEALTDFDYTILRESDGVILFRREGLCGAMDMDGKELLPAMYTQLVTTGRGDYLALIGDPNDESADAIMRVSVQNVAEPTGLRTSDGLQPFADGRMLYRSANTERYGYLNNAGGVAVEAVFEYAESFENGIARAAQTGRLGVIGTDGGWRILPEYDFIEIDQNVIVCMEGQSSCVVYDAQSCSERFRIEGGNLSAAVLDDRIIVADVETLQLCSGDGELLGTYSFSATIWPGAGEQMLLFDGEWGGESVRIIEADGTVGESAYQYLMALGDDRYACMKMQAAAYYSDTLDELRYSCNYDSMRFGMMDVRGRMIIPAEYTEIRAVGERRYLAVAQDGLRLFDENGGLLWSCLSDGELHE